MADHEDEVDMEQLARLSVATGFQYFKSMNDALVADTKRCLDECQRVNPKAGRGPIEPADYAEMSFWYRSLARATMSYVEGLRQGPREASQRAREIQSASREFCSDL